MPDKLTEKQALEAYKQICDVMAMPPAMAVYRQGNGAFMDMPVLVRDFESWSSTTDWAVVWECGGWDWPSEVSMKLLDSKAAFFEPINSYSIGLYPR